MSDSELEQLRTDPAYKSLYETFAVGSSPIVAVVGSGLSVPAGLPTWDGLKGHLVNVLRRKAESSEDDHKREQLGIARTAEQEVDYWVAFEILRKNLGESTYTGEIRNLLRPGEMADVPAAYAELWRTQIKGVLTVNLDSLARRAHSIAFPGDELKAFVGKDASRLTSLLHGPHRFLYNLHGLADDSDSWVFTHTELSKLLKNQSYQNLLRTIFSTYTILFVGISADDAAVGGPLRNLLRARIQGPTHYWLTDRKDQKTDEWAEAAGIRTIRYSSSHGHGVVKEVLNDLRSARLGDVVIDQPVLSTTAGQVYPIPPVDELILRPTEEVRFALNGHAAALLDEVDGGRKFSNFLDEYDEAVHRAWYTTYKPPKNKLFGNTLHEEVAKGAFGKVYHAEAENGDRVAVKVLLTELRTDIELLQSFRRGVHAMSILESHKVPGMVAYRDASEVPAFVTMDWIDGPNLKQAKESGYLPDWDVLLWVASELVTVLKRAHELPERVLHRDVRPANVMLRNGWVSRDYLEWELVVLDFDLSTFRGAHEKSVLAEGSALGFLAPEQLEQKSKFSTRNAAVDSFGFGMTLFFLCSGVDPEAYSQRRGDFQQIVRAATKRPAAPGWRSLQRRVERLIINSTVDDQSRRWDMSQIVRELSRLKVANSSPADVKDLDLLAEELVARSTVGESYDWSDDREQASYMRADGLSMSLAGPASAESGTLRIAWGSAGSEDRHSLTKYLPEKMQRAVASLKSGGWKQVSYKNERHSFTITAAAPYQLLSTDLDEASSSLSAALGEISFSSL